MTERNITANTTLPKSEVEGGDDRLSELPPLIRRHLMFDAIADYSVPDMVVLCDGRDEIEILGLIRRKERDQAKIAYGDDYPAETIEVSP